jgi:threonine/homoserine/homoserine lactone efflux protein
MVANESGPRGQTVVVVAVGGLLRAPRERGLTLRSSADLHRQGTLAARLCLPIIRLAAKPPRRWRPLRSNVRPTQMPESLLLFGLVAFIGIATPGPTVLLALTNGSKLGVRASLPGMFGAVLSDFVLISAVSVGLGALLAASEFWFSVVKWLGAAYLAYLGIRLLRSSGVLALPEESSLSRPTARGGVRPQLSGRRHQPEGLPVLLGVFATVHRAARTTVALARGACGHLRVHRLCGHAGLCRCRSTGGQGASCKGSVVA